VSLGSIVKSYVGIVSAEQKGLTIVLYGLNGYLVTRAIEKYWGTSRITSYLFSGYTSNTLRFHLFFAPDVYYIFEQLIRQSKLYYVPRPKLKAAQEALLESTWLHSAGLSHPPRLNLQHLKAFRFAPLPHQQDFLEHYSSELSKWQLQGCLLNAAAGTGKAQPLGAWIKVPGGWDFMGNMAVGREIIAKDGTVTRVTGVYPQDLKDVYRITFKDGRTAECCLDHLWKVYNIDWVESPKVISTQEIIRLLQFKSKTNRLYIDLIEPEDTPDIELPLDPYTLGVLLGDGHFGERHISLSNPELAIVDEVRKQLPGHLKLHLCGEYDYTITRSDFSTINDYLVVLRKLKLAGKLSHEKFVPKLYRFGSINQRRALLQGLMDTDGTVDKSGSLSFCSTSLVLAQDVAYLVQSLGGIAFISERDPVYTYQGEKRLGKRAYQVNIRHKKPKEFFRAALKKERLGESYQYSQSLKLGIKSVEYVGPQETQCISIDHPDRLYVTDNFVVTHNTYTGMAVGETLEADRILVVCPKNAVFRVWHQGLLDNYLTPPSYWIAVDNYPYRGERYLIFHYETLIQAVNLAGRFKDLKTCIILDESHNLNDIKAQRTQYFLDVCKLTGSQNILYASGTPIKAMGAESIPLFKAIDPHFDGIAEERFKKMHGTSGTATLDILAHRLELVSFKITKDVIQLEKPLMYNVEVKIPNGEDYTLAAIKEEMVRFIEKRTQYYQARRAEDEAFWAEALKYYETYGVRTRQDREAFETYRRALAAVIRAYRQRALETVKDEIMLCNSTELKVIAPALPKEMAERFKQTRSIIKYVGLKIQGECLGQVLGKKRTQCHVDMVPYVQFDDIINSTEKKTVIFTSYVEVVEKTLEHLKTLGIGALAVYGKTTAQLPALVDQFFKDDKIQVLVATYPSLSTAVPLTVANTALLLNAPFREYILNQAVSRVWRLGQDSQTRVFTALLNTGNDPNISTRSQDILAWSAEQVKLITGISSPFDLGEEGQQLALESHGPLPHLENDFSPALEMLAGEEASPGESGSIRLSPSRTTWADW
jgi:hypothetical protein